MRNCLAITRQTSSGFTAKVFASPQQGERWTQRLCAAHHPPELACISHHWNISKSFSSPLETQTALNELFAVDWGVAFPAHPRRIEALVVWTNTSPELPCHKAHICFVGRFLGSVAILHTLASIHILRQQIIWRL